MLFAYITQDTSLLRIHPLFAAHLTSRERRRVYRLHAAHTHTAIINSRFNARPLFVSKHVAGSIDQILTQPVTNEINCNNIILDLALRRLPETHFQELLSASPIAACCDLLSSQQHEQDTHRERSIKAVKNNQDDNISPSVRSGISIYNESDQQNLNVANREICN
jgi:hypothetical protein